MSTIIPATNLVSATFRFIGKDRKTTKFSIVGFVVSDSGEIEKAITFPKVPKSAAIEHHTGVSGWEPFSLEV